jgi:hypothetical protein
MQNLCPSQDAKRSSSQGISSPFARFVYCVAFGRWKYLFNPCPNLVKRGNNYFCYFSNRPFCSLALPEQAEAAAAPPPAVSLPPSESAAIMEVEQISSPVIANNLEEIIAPSSSISASSAISSVTPLPVSVESKLPDQLPSLSLAACASFTSLSSSSAPLVSLKHIPALPVAQTNTIASSAAHSKVPRGCPGIKFNEEWKDFVEPRGFIHARGDIHQKEIGIECILFSDFLWFEFYFIFYRPLFFFLFEIEFI